MKATILLLLCLLTYQESSITTADWPAAETVNQITIAMTLDENYDDTEPFVNERLFNVTQDRAVLTAEGALKMNGETGSLTIKDNQNGDLLWQKTWQGMVDEDDFTVMLENISKDKEYVLSFTGTKITYAEVGLTFADSAVREQETPRR